RSAGHRETFAATASPNTAIQARARTRFPRNTPRTASESTRPARPMGDQPSRPLQNTARRAAPHADRIRPPPEARSASRRTDAPLTETAPTSQSTSVLADRHDDPSTWPRHYPSQPPASIPFRRFFNGLLVGCARERG